MIVLREGTRPQDAICHGTCQYCLTLVEFQVWESSHTLGECAAGPSEYLVQCPTCKEIIIGTLGRASR